MIIPDNPFGPYARSALASFSIVIGLLGLFPEAVPIGLDHLAPPVENTSRLNLYAHFASNTILILSGIWLMLGACTKCAAVLCVAILSFHVYLIRVGFEAAPVVLLAFGVFCAACVLVMVGSHLRWDLRGRI